jgi:metallo-beta-lactamase family protein
VAADSAPSVSFLGAARSVTGSRYLLQAAGRCILVDCGLNQERDQEARNWEPFTVSPDAIDCLLLTHAHLDHCGLIPRLAKEGFRGTIFCTGPTAEIARIVMLDSARLQVEDVENKKKRHQRENRKAPHPLVPLYTEADAEKAASLFRTVRFGESVRIGDGIEADFTEAGHILGSASIRVRVAGGDGGARRRGGPERSIVFSGDIGRWDKPILKDPNPFDRADYLLMESTYGDSVHEGEGEIQSRLREIITSTVKAGGNVVIPSFAIERSQEVLFYLNKLLMANEIPHLLVFLDSPMATRVTEIFGRFPEFLDAETLELIRRKSSPFDIPGLMTTRSAEDSKAINRITGSVIIIAGAGMCTGGRIKHHLARNIERPESAILFVGYQASGTLGREIQDGAKEVRILGENHPVRARVFRIGGFSAHADRNELLRWAGYLKAAPRGVFITHGEPETAQHFRDFLAAEKGWEVSVPSPGQVVQLA